MMKKEEPTTTTEKRNCTLAEGFWLDSASKVRRHTILGENPASAKLINGDKTEESHFDGSEVSQAKPST